jgi:hypothetical protein
VQDPLQHPHELIQHHSMSAQTILRALPPFVLISGLFAIHVTAQEAFQGPEVERFLKESKIVAMQALGKGATSAQKATLELNGTTHDAVFKTIDERQPQKTFADGRIELDFQDSWRTEIAAYELDRLLGLGMVPATVERIYDGRQGSLQFWVTTKIERVSPKDLAGRRAPWNRQMFRMKLFDSMIYNTDRHQDNILCTDDFQVRLIDHSRSFRMVEEPKDPQTLTRFSKSLLEKMAQLTEPVLQERLGAYLSQGQIRAMLRRRGRILALAHDLAQQKGEVAVLYP